MINIDFLRTAVWTLIIGVAGGIGCFALTVIADYAIAHPTARIIIAIAAACVALAVVFDETRSE